MEEGEVVGRTAAPAAGEPEAAVTMDVSVAFGGDAEGGMCDIFL